MTIGRKMPKVAGMKMLGTIVTLYANSTIVGTTTVASNGNWDITSQELSDGAYDLSVEIRTQSGQVVKRSVKSVVIDTIAPQFVSVNGLMDGVAWDASDVFSGAVKDVDNQSKLEYWVNDGSRQAIGLTSTLDFNNVSLNAISTLSKNTEHKFHLKSIDRAGNETQYDYSFMRLDLPEMTEDTDWSGPVSGGADDRTTGGSGSGGVLPSGSGGSYFIGSGGGWGYSSGSGGTYWNPAPFGGSGGNPPSPTKPGQDPNEQLTYLQALDVILNTAADALSKHSSVIVKKQVLSDFKADLLAMGKVIEVYNLHDGFKTEFNELFSLGYDSSDNRVSWQEAVSAGWKFAKAVALDSKPVRLKAFQSEVFGMVRGMMAAENISVSAIQEQQLKQTLETFSRRYAILKPEWGGTESTRGDAGFFGEIWLPNNWSWGWRYPDLGQSSHYIESIRTSLGTADNYWMGKAFNHLQSLVKGLTATQVIEGFDNAQVLLNGTSRVSALWNRGYITDIYNRDGVLLREIVETGFELTRLGVTNPGTIVTNSSAWLEAVLDKNVQLVSGGLSQFFQGFSDLFMENQPRHLTPLVEALDYGQRLMRAAAGIQDLGLRAQVLRSDTLSELVNLGGAYASLKPTRSSGLSNDFLASIWNDISSKSMGYCTNKIEEFLAPENPENLRDIFRYQSNVFLASTSYVERGIFRRASIPESLIAQGQDFQIAYNPYAFNYGNIVHKNISADYAAKHYPQRIFVDNRISTILKEYQINYGDRIDMSVLSESEKIKRPDIFNYTKDYLYEIKPVKDYERGLIDARTKLN